MNAGETLGRNEKTRKLGFWLMALGTLCLLASAALVLAAHILTRMARR
jgi:hypothetical protein